MRVHVKRSFGKRSKEIIDGSKDPSFEPSYERRSIDIGKRGPAQEFNVVISCYVFLTNRSSRPTWAVPLREGALSYSSRQNRIGCESTLTRRPPLTGHREFSQLSRLPLCVVRACVPVCVCRRYSIASRPLVPAISSFRSSPNPHDHR